MELSDVPHVGLDEAMGLRVTLLEPDRVTGSLEVLPHLLDATGTLHRGVISAMVETLASVAAAAWFLDRGQVVGVSNTTSHFAGVSAGRVTAVAEPVGRQDDLQVWSVTLHDAGGRLLSSGVVQLANMPDAGRLGR